MNEPTTEDIAAIKADGDLKNYLLALAGRTPKAPPKPAAAELEKPKYHIPRKGAWPCGTAPSGPTPKPCTDCQEGDSP
jgi:hypothetical protein